jgi:hypothetical protein
MTAPGRRQPCAAPRQAGRALLNVLEDLADELWIGDVRDDPQLPAAERAKGDIDFENALQSLRQVSDAVGGSLASHLSDVNPITTGAASHFNG